MNTALVNETASYVHCFLFVMELRTIKSWVQSTQIHHRYPPLPLWEGLPISEPPDNFTPDCDEEEENETEETIQSSTSRNPVFKVKETSPQSHKIKQVETPDFVNGLQLTNDTAGPFLQVYNTGIFWMTCESESISLTAKRF
jgi:hypothetical protein